MGKPDRDVTGRRGRRWQPAEGLVHAGLGGGDLDRSYWLAPAPEAGAPLIVAFHGLGTNGRDMAAFTGLAARGPAAGFAVAFPDGTGQAWDGAPHPTAPGRADDAAFVNALVSKLVEDGTARKGALFLVGLSNGALFVEHLARQGLVSPAGVMTVSGTARVTSRRAVPRPRASCAFVSVQGTADPIMPFEGGRAGGKGLAGWLVRRRARSTGRGVGDQESEVAGAEAVASDWAAARGTGAPPQFDSFPISERRLHLTRTTWSEAGHPPVVLYSIEGGGHGWPGGPQYLPAWLIGRVSRDFDATAVLLEMARHETGRLSGGDGDDGGGGGEGEAGEAG